MNKVFNSPFLWLGLIAAIAITLAVIFVDITEDDIQIYVDNTGGQSLSVYIDGEPKAVVEAKTVGVVKCRSGEHNIKITAGQEIVIERTENLMVQKARKGKYLVAIGDECLYWIYEKKYKVSTDFDFSFSMPNFITSMEELRKEYKKLADSITIKKAEEPWYGEVQCDYVLTDEIPDTIRIYGSNSVTKKVFARLGSENYQFLVQAQNNSFPSEEDYNQLVKFLEKLYVGK